jgi:hypothetical protein
MNETCNKNLISATVINGGLFILLFFFCFPVYHSGDDVFLLYLMGGGFAQEPTALLHYNHIMHPILGNTLATLFKTVPFINWYTLLLLLVHYVCTSTLLFVILQRQPKLVAIILYLVFFVIIEAWFLLQLTFSVTAAIAGMAATAVLWHNANTNKEWVYYIFPAALLLTGALFRIHVLIPVVLLASPLLIAPPFFINRLKLMVTLLIVVLITAALNYQHQQYYQKNSAGWQLEENYRQAVFNYYNKPLITKDPNHFSIQEAFISYGIYFDQEFLSSKEINELAAKNRVPQNQYIKNGLQRLYWPAIESRIFILTLLLASALLLFTNSSAKRWLGFMVPAAALFLLLYLHFFLKLPFYLVPVIIGAAICIIFVSLPSICLAGIKSGIAAVLVMFCISWGVVRLQKISKQNKKENTAFKEAQVRIAAMPQHLFIVTEDSFPMDSFSIWDSPAKYALPNLLYKDHFFNNEYQPTLNRFHINTVKQLWQNQQVLWWGKRTDILKYYYQQRYGTAIQFSAPLPNFGSATVRRIEK